MVMETAFISFVPSSEVSLSSYRNEDLSSTMAMPSQLLFCYPLAALPSVRPRQGLRIKLEMRVQILPHYNRSMVGGGESTARIGR